MSVLKAVVAVVAFVVLVAEFWTGIAVVGWSGDKMVITRGESPGPYWVMMTLHSLAVVGIPLLATWAL